MHVYREQCKRKLCDIHQQTQADNVHVTLFRGLSLQVYVTARSMHCQSGHVQPCLGCKAMMSVAYRVLGEGYCLLSDAFRLAFPDQTYKADIVMQRFLQMPLASIRVGIPQSGRSAWYLIEFVEGVDYVKFARLSDTLFLSGTPSHSVGIDRDKVKALLGLACSDRERELIRYSVLKASGLSLTGARRHFGFERMHERATAVEECIEEAQRVRAAIDELSSIQDRALLRAMGLPHSESETDSDSEAEKDSETLFEPPLSQGEMAEPPCQTETAVPPCQTEMAELPYLTGTAVPCQTETAVAPHQTETAVILCAVSFHTLKEVLQQGQYNWFFVVEYLEHRAQTPLLESHLKEFHSYALELPLTSEQKNLLTLSYEAFSASIPDANHCRTAAALNGDIVSDSESDNAEDYVGISSVASEDANKIIAKKRKSFVRRLCRVKAKKLAERNFLSRRTSKRVKTVVDRFPDIGESIESFVSDSNVGADAWRRTGVLTFDGNMRVKQKVTYGRIQQHLQDRYQWKFSYGTVVQLCIARNKRRRSASNYKGVAKVTTRRARKGFDLRYNPDKHWSGALYRGLDFIEHTDGTDITNINRDDASVMMLSPHTPNIHLLRSVDRKY